MRKVTELLETMISAKQLSVSDADKIKQLQESHGAGTLENEEDVLRWLADEYGFEYTDLDEVVPDKALLALFPARVLLKYEMLPLREENGSVRIATSRLFETQGLDALRVMTGKNLVPALASTEAIRRALKERLGIGADTLHTIEEQAPLEVVNEDIEDDMNLDGAEEEASIIRFVNQVLTDAIALRATDVHLEPYEDDFRIRYRIDGVLQDIPAPAQVKRFQPAIVSRLKILSHLDIAEKRLPQDGRIKIRIKDKEVDVRVSVIPMLYGEAVVLRLLHQESALRGLKELLMGERESRILKAVLELPHGIMLVTGPTGSGKTTTLYAALSEINDEERKIVTIEDPIEYHLKGLNQIQVSEKSGLTFARGLRSILRHDPDVILVGEIRDTETSEIAVQASLTGHLVFSTLHTNDAAGAITRLIDMGVEPYLVASSLESVLAQRLVRTICPYCKKEIESPLSEEWYRELGLKPGTPLYRGEGCEACRQTGYFGRQAIFEMMPITDEIRALVLEAHSSREILSVARNQGLSTLREDGFRLVREGKTTIDEVLRVSKDDRLNGSVGIYESRSVEKDS